MILYYKVAFWREQNLFTVLFTVNKECSHTVCSTKSFKNILKLYVFAILEHVLFHRVPCGTQLCHCVPWSKLAFHQFGRMGAGWGAGGPGFRMCSLQVPKGRRGEVEVLRLGPWGRALCSDCDNHLVGSCSLFFVGVRDSPKGGYFVPGRVGLG